MLIEHWNGTTKGNNDLSDVDALDDSSPGYFSAFTDGAYFVEPADSAWGNYVSKLRGFFIPPKTGLYTMHVMADDGAHLLLSNSSDPMYKVCDS